MIPAITIDNTGGVMNNSSADRRKYPRFKLEAKLKIQVQKKNNKTPVEVSGRVRNMSIEGLCFASGKEFKNGEKLHLKIWLPSEPKPLQLQGETKWCIPVKRDNNKKLFETGVKLFILKQKDEDKFIGYVCEKTRNYLSQYLHL